MQQEQRWRFRRQDIQRGVGATEPRRRWRHRQLGGAGDRHQRGDREPTLRRFARCGVQRVIGRVVVMRAMTLNRNGMGMQRNHADVAEEAQHGHDQQQRRHPSGTAVPAHGAESTPLPEPRRCRSRLRQIFESWPDWIRSTSTFHSSALRMARFWAVVLASTTQMKRRPK